MKYKAIIFDFDGILNDTEEIKFNVWKKVTNKKLNRLYYIQNLCGQSAEFIAQSYKNKYKLKNSIKDIVLRNKKLAKSILLKNVRPIKENIKFLKECYKLVNIKIGVASSQDRAILIPSLRRLKIIKYFHTIIAGHEIKNLKPASDIYLAICKKLKVNPEESVVIEDSQAGVESAYNADIGLIVAVPGYFTKLQDFSKAHIVIGKKIKPVKGQKHLLSINAIEALF